MSKTVFHFIIMFILLIPAQALIFNRLILFDMAMPMAFIYIIVSMPVTLATNWAIAIGFATGLAIDIFSDTPGMNALACTLLAFIRKPVYHLYMSIDDDLSGMRPSISTMGSGAYAKYMSTMSLAYCLSVFAIEAFHLFNPLGLALRTLCSAAFTFVIIYAIDSLSIKKS